MNFSNGAGKISAIDFNADEKKKINAADYISFASGGGLQNSNFQEDLLKSSTASM